MGPTTPKKIAKSHTQNRDRGRPDPGQDRILTRERGHVPAHILDRLGRNLVLLDREHCHDRARVRDRLLRDIRHRITTTKAVHGKAKRLAIDRGHRRSRLAKRSPNTTRILARLHPKHLKSTKKASKRNTNAGGTIETGVTIGTITESIGIVRQRVIGTRSGIGIVTANVTGTKVATIGMTIERTTVVTMGTVTNGTNIAAVATAMLVATTDIDLQSTGTAIGIGIVEDKVVLLYLARLFFNSSYGYAILETIFLISL